MNGLPRCDCRMRSPRAPLLHFIDCIEQRLGQKAIRNVMPMQAGDVQATWADHRLLEALTGFRPATSVEEGVGRFVDWYREFYSR